MDKAHKEIVKKRENSGWKVVVAGKSGVVKNPNSSLKYNYWFVFEFTGIKSELKARGDK